MKKLVGQDSWKRPVYQEVTPMRDYRYAQQLELQLNKTVDATPEEFEKWRKEELDWYADRQIPFIAFMAFVQVFAFGSMLMAFYLIGLAV